MQATFVANVHHAVLGMLLAVHCSLVALDVVVRASNAGVMCATLLAAGIHHSFLSMFLAVDGLLQTCEVVRRSPRARFL